MPLVIPPYACLQLPNPFESEFPILVALYVFLGELPHLEVYLSILLFIDFQPIPQCLHHLLLHLVQKHC